MAAATRTVLLVTNDDGIEAPGLRALEAAMARLGEVWTVAPVAEQSASSRSITVRRPIRYQRRGRRRFAVEGTPTDCVMLALNLLLDTMPRLVVSGINSGPNLGENIFYSGTVAGAAEAAKVGLPAMAVSVDQRFDIDFEPSARIAADLGQWFLEHGMEPGVAMNVNVPSGEPSGLMATTQCRKISRDRMVETRDPHGRPFYWVHEDVHLELAEEGSDYAAVRDGKVSVTPLQFEHTAAAAMDGLRRTLDDCRAVGRPLGCG